MLIIDIYITKNIFSIKYGVKQMKLYTQFGRLILPVVVFILFFNMSCNENPTKVAHDNTSVAGALVDEQGTPVPLAIIEVYNPLPSVLSLLAKDTTDEDGKFSLSKIPGDAAMMNIKITHQDFKKTDIKFLEFKNKSSEPFLLCHQDTCTGVLGIHTFNNTDSSKLSEVEVRLFRDGNLIRKACTKDGGLAFTNVCPGKYLMRLYKYGYGLIYDSVEVKGSDTIPFHFYMQSGLQDSCCHGKLTILVRDSANSEPLPDVLTYLYLGGNKLAYGKTDSTGQITFSGLCPGDYNASFSKTGYINGYLHNIHLDCNDTVGVDQLLTKAPKTDTCCTAAIIAKVVGTDSSAISEATVYIFRSGGETITGTTDSNGYFRIYHLCAPVSYTVKAIKDGYNHNYIPVSFTKCDTQYVHLVLTPKAADTCCNGMIYISLKDSASGLPITGGVSYLYQGNNKIASAHPDSNGLVIFSKICPGDYSVNFSITGYNNKSIYYIHMDCNDTLITDHFLSKTHKDDTCCTAALITRVMGTDSAAIAGATVYICRSGGETITGTTDSYGFFKAYNLCAPGSYTVKATKDGYNYQYLPVTFTKCDTQYVHLVLIPNAADTCCNGMIYISLKDSATGAPITSGLSYLYHGSNKIGSAHVDSNGLVVFSKICPGDYSVNFSINGYYNKTIYNIHMDCNDTLITDHYLAKTKKIDTCCTAVISAFVFDSSDSTALQGASIIICKDNQPIVNDSTDSKGRFIKYNLCAPGKYTVKVSKTGYKHQYFTVEFTVCKTEYLHVALKKE